MIQELYKQQIIELYKSPPHKGEVTCPTHTLHGDNPTCGDNITIGVTVKNGIIQAIKYTGEGCAISQAGLNLLIDEIVDKPLSDLQKLSQKDIVALLGVPISSARMNCAILGLRTCKQLL